MTRSCLPPLPLGSTYYVHPSRAQVPLGGWQLGKLAATLHASAPNLQGFASWSLCFCICKMGVVRPTSQVTMGIK